VVLFHKGHFENHQYISYVKFKYIFFDLTPKTTSVYIACRFLYNSCKWLEIHATLTLSLEHIQKLTFRGIVSKSDTQSSVLHYY